VLSNREIERRCDVDVAYRVVCGQDAPDHTRIPRFRAELDEMFDVLLGQVLGLCGRASLGRGGLTAVDGTKIAANASLGSNRTEEWLGAEASRLCREADVVDAAEDALFGQARGDELPAELADPNRGSDPPRPGRAAELQRRCP
jgi:hypothetical protein